MWNFTQHLKIFIVRVFKDVISALNGFDVLSPKNDTVWEEESVYDGTQDWVKNGSMWLVEKGCECIFLFGISARLLVLI